MGVNCDQRSQAEKARLGSKLETCVFRKKDNAEVKLSERKLTNSNKGSNARATANKKSYYKINGIVGDMEKMVFHGDEQWVSFEQLVGWQSYNLLHSCYLE